MKAEEIEKGNLKLTVFDSFPYEDLKKVCDAICKLGYECEFVDNGNIVFQRMVKEEEENEEYSECSICIHRSKKSPCPCDSCEQDRPTNLEEG